MSNKRKAVHRAMTRRLERLAAAPRSGKLWTPEEKAELVIRFDNGVPLPEIAKHHGRTKSAIVSQLTMMNLLTFVGDGYYRLKPGCWATIKEINS